MNLATLEDGRTVLVDHKTKSDPTRKVSGEEFFVDMSKYSICYINGSWQPVLSSKLKNVPFGHPFEALR